MREDLYNVGLVHPECASKPGKFAGQLATIFLGKYVKLAFTGGMVGGYDAGRKEHMWVLVNAYDAATKTLSGNLNNDPVFDYGDQKLYDGSFIDNIKVEDIEEMCE